MTTWHDGEFTHFASGGFKWACCDMPGGDPDKDSARTISASVDQGGDVSIYVAYNPRDYAPKSFGMAMTPSDLVKFIRELIALVPEEEFT